MSKLPNVALILILFGALTECRHPPLVGDHPSELVGKWELLIRSSCDDDVVKSDELVLRADGTFDQFVTLKDAKQVRLTGQRWQYESDGSDGTLHSINA